MSSNKNLVEFPDAEAKLAKPAKKSAFERQKAEAEAKRRREEEETAVALQSFIKEFADDDSDGHGIFSQKSRQVKSGAGSGPPDRPHFGSQAPPFGGGAGKRHFGVPSSTPVKSGPGSLGPVPSSFGKKRSYDGFQRSANEPRGKLGFEDRETGPLTVSKAFDNASDDEEKHSVPDRAEEKAVSKPTLRLTNIPPNTSPAAIKALIPSTLTVENVKIAPPSGPGGTERKSITAIVTLTAETSAKDIESVVNALQNKYLGFGYFLSLHRHLSSAAIASGLPTIQGSTAASQPFGAKPIEQLRGNQGHNATRFSRGIPPPDSYNTPAGNQSGSRYYVDVRPPRDIRQLRMIHIVAEQVLKHGAEVEALLMSRPEVQREEKWAWFWDARSVGGVWYRWRIWEFTSGKPYKPGEMIRLFQGNDQPLWKVPEPLPHEFATSLEDFVSDSDYHSEDEDGFEDSGNGPNNEEETFLGPIDKAQLTYFLARLPTTASKLTKADLAAVTTFAMTHANRGPDEIVDLVLQNVETPFAYTSANPKRKELLDGKGSRDDNYRDTSPTKDGKTEADTLDKSSAHLVGLNVISDIVSASGQCSIRHAWRFRQLFETALKERGTFEMLGMIPERLNLGRLRADKWKRSVNIVLEQWESLSAFSPETHAYFVNSFHNPPVPKKGSEDHEQEQEQEKKAGRWKTIESSAHGGSLPVSEQPVIEPQSPANSEEDDELLESSDSDEDSSVPTMEYSLANMDTLTDEDMMPAVSLSTYFFPPNKQPYNFKEDAKEETPSPATTEPAVKMIGGFRISASNTGPPRKRMQAMDMFADGDSDGDN